MEKLPIQNLGSVAVNSVDIGDSIDREFKTGFYKETELFINDIKAGKKMTIQD